MPTKICRQGGCGVELPVVPADPAWPNHCAMHAASKGPAAAIAREIGRRAAR